MADSDAQTVRATRYCRECGYVLDGLSEMRCPECGRGFDPDNPATYRNHGRRGWNSRFARISVRVSCALGILAVLASLIGYFVDYGRRLESCAYCGTNSTVRFVRLSVIGGDYDRETIRDVVPRFIQEQDEKACEHDWICYHLSDGNVFTRQSRMVAVYDFVRMFTIKRIDGPSAMPFLRAKAAADPGFIVELKAAIQTVDQSFSETYLSQLSADFNAWKSGNTR